jgi:hypothetical protein
MKMGELADNRGVVDPAPENPCMCSGFRNGEGALL